MNYWLLKSEGACYSIDDLKKAKVTQWTGIRNYQARNYMTNDMKVGDLILFYHSNGGEETGIVGVAEVVGAAHPDLTGLDKKDEHFDPKATKDKPIWFGADISYKYSFKKPVLLTHIKFDSDLKNMLVAKRGMRLSVMPVIRSHFDKIVKLGMK